MLLEKRLGCKVYVENDTRAMTYGEYMCGVGNNEDTMIFVNASWGLGVGLVIDRNCSMAGRDSRASSGISRCSTTR